MVVLNKNVNFSGYTPLIGSLIDKNKILEVL